MVDGHPWLDVHDLEVKSGDVAEIWRAFKQARDQPVERMYEW